MCVIAPTPLNLLEERKDANLRISLTMVSAVFIPIPLQIPLLDNPLFRRDEERMRFLRNFFFANWKVIEMNVISHTSLMYTHPLLPPSHSLVSASISLRVSSASFASSLYLLFRLCRFFSLSPTNAGNSGTDPSDIH